VTRTGPQAWSNPEARSFGGAGERPRRSVPTLVVVGLMVAKYASLGEFGGRRVGIKGNAGREIRSLEGQSRSM